MQTLRDLMTPDPVVLDANDTVGDAALVMKQRDIGDVLVRADDGKLYGIVTDRDMVVRCLAEAVDRPASKRLADICTREVTALPPEAPVGEAIRVMEEHAIRRLPVVEDGEPVGIVSLGDLAIARDRDSVLGRISAAEPNG
jgi:CBS domain-containing protein